MHLGRSRRRPRWPLGGTAGACLAAVLALAACSSGAATGGNFASTGPSAPTTTDTGAPGSTCEPIPTPRSSRPEPGTRAGTYNGDYYELGNPIPFRRHAPMLVILHGGGWWQIGSGPVQSERPVADGWRRHRWRTLNLDYHGCASSVGDVIALYDHFRKLASGHAICAFGESAGGHLALMLAVNRPAVRCVIAYAAPMDLPALPGSRTIGGLPGQPTTSGPEYVYDAAIAAFGAHQLTNLSPTRQAQRIKARVLLAEASNDFLIPWSQLTGFAARRPRRTRIMHVPPGPVQFVHGTSTVAGLQRIARAAFQLAAGLH